MPGVDEISTSLGLTGEGEYRDGLKEIGAALGVVASEVAKTSAAYDKNDKSVAALSARNTGLEKKLGLQRQKVELCRKGLENANATWGEASEKAQQWQKDLNYAEAAVTKTEAAVKKNTTAIEEMNRAASGKGLKDLAAGAKEAGDRLNSAGNTLTVGLTAPLAAAGTAAVNFASDTAESVNKVEVAFGYAAEGVKHFSDTSLTSFGLAKGTALDMAALYGDMATSMGFSQAAAADMAKELVGLAGDLSSFKNISVEMSNTALKSIFTGETESLKNLGVVMTEANLKNYAMAQGFKTAYTEMDQTEKVAVRLQYVLDATKNAQGDFARTSDGTANQLRILTESLKEAAATAGEELLPVVTPIISKLGELAQGFGDLDEGTRKAVVQTALWVATLGPMLKLTGGVTTAINLGVSAYAALTAKKVADTVVTGGQAVATTTATVAQTGLNAAMAANPIGLVITAVGVLVAALLSFGAVSALTSEKTESLNQKLRESKEAYAQNKAAIGETSADTMNMVSTLESLVAAEDKTAGQKAVILDMVQQLNEAVPNLNLAYDEQTDSLNMTAESMRRMAEAMNLQQEQEEDVRRMSELLSEQQGIASELEQAKSELLAAETAYAQYDGTVGSARAQDKAFNEVKLTLAGARANVERLTNAEAENAAEVAALDQKYGMLAETVAETSAAFPEPVDALQAFTDVLGTVEGAYGLLSKAQKETADSGALSVSTLKTLTEKYPELRGYLEETEDGYRLTDRALQSYIDTQRAEYQVALNEAQQGAAELIRQETGETDAINATTAAIKLKLQALQAEARAKANSISSSASG